MRLRSPIKLAVVLAMALSSVASAAAVPRSASRAHEAIVGGSPAPISSTTLTGSAASSGSAGAFASVAEVIDLRGREIGQCTGTVVAANLILTAGHCAENVKTGVPNAASGYRVLTTDPGAAGGEMQLSTVSGVIVYERFRRRIDDGDAALLVLAAPTTAPAITLATSADAGAVQAGTTATIAGWGNMRFAQRLPTEGLRWADTVVQGTRWCARNAPPFDARSEICTIDPPRYATGACNGDSGGPLLAAQGAGEEPVEIGLVIHGYNGCSTRQPSVFTRVDAIAPWIKSWVAAYQPAPASSPAAGSSPAPEAPSAPPASPAQAPASPGS